MKELFDIVIVGAGPAGCACAYKLAQSGFKVAILEKDEFPRDKICGDALSPDVINQLTRIDPELGQHFESFPARKASHGVRFFSPNSQKLDITFQSSKYRDAKGFIVKRIDFDRFLFERLSTFPNVHTFQHHKVEDIQRDANGVSVMTNQGVTFRAKTVIGADGAYSIVNKKLTNNKVDKKHYSAGLRQYYSNVNGFHEEGYIELHFHKDILPGYFWIFPLANNQANVGLGMLSSEAGKRKVNLREKLEEIIKTHPKLKERFKDAVPLEKVKGFGLPMGSKKRTCSGDRFLLLGDAASLIDPFSGEGIGMAIRSGRIAAEHLVKAFELNRFDAKFNKQYDKEIYSKMWFELYCSRVLQKLLKFPSVFNFAIKMAAQYKSFEFLLTFILDNRDLKSSFFSFSFYQERFFSPLKRKLFGKAEGG